MNFAPHDYQAYAIDYIETHPVAAVLLDMGLGKTVISLTAIADLLFDSFETHRILVVAPLRVARDTWPAEIRKWQHLNHLTFAVCVGTPKERKAALMAGADITIINRENLQWLIESSGFPFDYDMVVIDELSSFKNHNSKRFKDILEGRKIDPTFYPVIYGADETDDWTDPEVWKKANPSLGITVGIDKVEAACESAKQNPGEENSFNAGAKAGSRWSSGTPLDDG